MGLKVALHVSQVSPEVVVPPVVVEDMEVEQGEASATDMIPESQVAYEQRFKRPPDVPTEQLEREMNEKVKEEWIRLRLVCTGLTPVNTEQRWLYDLC